MPLRITDTVLPPLRRPWRMGVAVGRAYELLRADVQTHLRYVRERVGFEYCRFHGLFHDDMLVALRDSQGGLHFQWNQVDKALDFLREIGMRPFVELGPMPSALASGPETFFYWRMNVTPPRDWDEWEALVEDFVRHCVRRYGVEEVRTWYFEVWNEPNLRAFWAGTWEQYLELYARAAAAVKRVDPALRVGGPASAEAKRVPNFLAGCEAAAAPVDFVSTHVYPQNEWNWYEGVSPHRPGEFFFDTVRGMRAQAAGKPIFWTEWNALSARTREDVDWTDNPSIDRLEAAAFTARACLALDADSEGMFWWVASDVFEEAGISQSPFSGTYGLLTVDGIPKSTFRAFELLSKLGGEGLVVEGAEHRGPCGAWAARDGELVRVLLWNDAAASAEPWSDRIECPFSAEALGVVLQIKKGQGSAYEAWQAMGSPQELTPTQREALETASRPHVETVLLDPTDGMATVRFTLQPGEVALVELAPREEEAHSRRHYAEVAGWNSALGERAEN